MFASSGPKYDSKPGVAIPAAAASATTLSLSPRSDHLLTNYSYDFPSLRDLVS